VGAPLAFGVVFSLTLFGVVPAANAVDQTEAVADLVQELAPNQGEVAATGTAEVAGTGEIAALSTEVGVASEVRSASGEVQAVIPLPLEASDALPVQASDGTNVVVDDAGSMDVAVQVLENGATRVQTVLHNDDAPSTQTYPIPEGFEATSDGNGGIVLSSEEGMFVLAAPWAVDANGADLETHYEIVDGAILQQVEITADTVYPVVADPTWMWYSAGYGAMFTRRETRGLASWGSVTGFCAALGKQYGIACGIYGAYLFTRLVQINNRGNCLFLVTVPAPGAALDGTGSACRN